MTDMILPGPNEEQFGVRFTTFYDPAGPILACCFAGPFLSATFSSKGSPQFESTEQMIAALNLVGMPGREIALGWNGTKVYYLTVRQLHSLGLRVPHSFQRPSEEDLAKRFALGSIE
ncbi:MAG TPA: hypothetical protein VEI08_02765 [Candidatus Bathyarchaeia archaeon]|nr:hypothetical protein [Candidatus Bathyarchaeia archaeon]